MNCCFAASVSILTCLAITGCGGGASSGVSDQSANFTGADVPHSKPVDFDGTGSASAIKLGKDSAQFRASTYQPSFVDALKTERHAVTIAAATYSQVPDSYLGDLTAKRAQETAFQLIFRADGSSPGDSKGFGVARNFEPSTDHLKCDVISPEQVGAAALKFHSVDEILSDNANANAEQAASKLRPILADAASAITAADVHATFSQCTWVNPDFPLGTEAIVSVDAGTHMVRVLTAFDSD